MTAAEVFGDLDRVHVETRLTQCGDDLQSGGAADLAFGGDAAVEHGDAGHAAVLSAGTPMRWISHSSVTPVAACTRCRTSSPRAFDIGGGRGAGVDQEIAVLFGHHRAAAGETAAADWLRSIPTPSCSAGCGTWNLRCVRELVAMIHAPRGFRPFVLRWLPARPRERAGGHARPPRHAAGGSGDRRRRGRRPTGGECRRTA